MATLLTALLRAIGRVLLPIGIVTVIAGAAAGYLGARSPAATADKGATRPS